MESTVAQPQTIRILPADVTIDHRSGESIVEAIRRNGYRTKYLCRRGGCGQCTAQIVTGRVLYLDAVSDSVLGIEEARSGAFLPCRAQPDGAVTVRLAAGDRLRDVLGPLRPAHH